MMTMNTTERVGGRELTRNISLECDYDVDVDGDGNDNFHYRASISHAIFL